MGRTHLRATRRHIDSNFTALYVNTAKIGQLFITLGSELIRVIVAVGNGHFVSHLKCRLVVLGYFGVLPPVSFKGFCVINA